MSTTYPPLYPLSNDNRAGVVVITAVVTAVFTLIVLTIKCSVRPGVSITNPSDIVILISITTYLIETAFVVVACNHGLGQPQGVLPANNVETVKRVCIATLTRLPSGISDTALTDSTRITASGPVELCLFKAFGLSTYQPVVEVW
jgi:hypothetical protein